MSALELYPRDGETIAELLAKAAQARALTDLVKDAQSSVDGRLRDAVEQTQRATGTAFTARADGWSAVLTDPQPKPRVTDAHAFEQWWAAQGFEHQTVERVEVVDHVRAADALREMLSDGAHADLAATHLLDALVLTTEYVLPENPLDTLVKSGRCVVTADGLVDTETGETVPGVDVTVAKQTLQVRGDQEAKARTRREVADTIGLRPELVGGDA